MEFLEKYFRDDEKENVYVYQSIIFDPPSTGGNKYRISIPSYSYDHQTIRYLVNIYDMEVKKVY